MPLKATEVDTSVEFAGDEALYRRVSQSELIGKGEVDPTRISISRFKKEIASAPSVLRSRFSQAPDALHVLCAGRDTAGWSVFYILVDSLPRGLTTGDGRTFDFFAVHQPLADCGAHSVVACHQADDAEKVYLKTSDRLAFDFKVRFATALRLAFSELMQPVVTPITDQPTG